jgi:hypothetical protein
MSYKTTGEIIKELEAENEELKSSIMHGAIQLNHFKENSTVEGVYKRLIFLGKEQSK